MSGTLLIVLFCFVFFYYLFIDFFFCARDTSGVESGHSAKYLTFCQTVKGTAALQSSL